MFGAIIGDLAGSIYEYGQTRGVSNIELNELMHNNAFISDDTVLTMAILDSVVNKTSHENNLKNMQCYIWKNTIRNSLF